MTDQITVNNEQDYKKIQAELNARKKPSKTLCFMMQALENYRQSKKMGWSRAWNKFNVTTFQSFKLNAKDHWLRQKTWQFLTSSQLDMPPVAQEFVAELLQSEQMPMGFLFFQEFTEQDRHYEGAVVSYGRINKDHKRFRDRLDVIFESEVIDGISQGLSRVRIYVDPYLGHNQGPLWQTSLEISGNQTETLGFFQQLAELSWLWATDKTRIWQHWVIDYIDYFGPRQWPMVKSYFYVATTPDCRIHSEQAA